MRQRLTVILTFVVIIGVLVVINAVTRVQEEETKDLEIAPNRSTYHSGPTGIRAFHDFLNESGYRVMRWREPLSQLLNASGRRVATLVVVGDPRVPFEDEDYTVLRHWISQGGRLVVVDRSPARELLSTEGWAISITGYSFPNTGYAFPNLDTDPGDVNQMTTDVPELKPVQPTLLTNNVESVMSSRFATRLVITAVPPAPHGAGIGPGETDPRDGTVISEPTPTSDESEWVLGTDNEVTEPTPEQSESGTPPPPTVLSPEADDSEEEYPLPVAPVIHVGDQQGGVLVDYAYGNGRVVLLSDPYIVTNGGIRLKDNLTLAINLIGGPQAAGLIAFDEYHQGRGVTRNAFANYFAGTPVLAIAGQIVLLVLVVLWTNGRRFARPLPLPHVDRRSSLEFVASMAELQERSRAFDLAIENIYSRTRRVLARHAGIDYNSSRAEIAERIASRSSIDRNELEMLMKHCEDAINGEPINSRQSMQLVRRLREIERDLGLRMRSRDARQAAEHI